VEPEILVSRPRRCVLAPYGALALGLPLLLTLVALAAMIHLLTPHHAAGWRSVSVLGTVTSRNPLGGRGRGSASDEIDYRYGVGHTSYPGRALIRSGDMPYAQPGQAIEVTYGADNPAASEIGLRSTDNSPAGGGVVLLYALLAVASQVAFLVALMEGVKQRRLLQNGAAFKAAVRAGEGHDLKVSFGPKGRRASVSIYPSEAVRRQAMADGRLLILALEDGASSDPIAFADIRYWRLTSKLPTPPNLGSPPEEVQADVVGQGARSRP